ncbi:MAG TPA: alanine racemase [Solirubrobacteraceae bacterium]|nr:alanine racemase [Solirubrobacteraceae bacterium]
MSSGGSIEGEVGIGGVREGGVSGDQTVGSRRAVAYVDPDAIAHNCGLLLDALAGPGLCAVVKADGYGHGAVLGAKAALGAGASWLAVATLAEAEQLREAGIEAPVLVMGPVTERSEIEQAIDLKADIVAWRERTIALAAEAAARARGTARVHVKLDTGMGRLGTREVFEADLVVAAATNAPGVRLVGAMTHFATADILDDDGFYEAQLAKFTRWAAAVRAEHPDVLVHAANSAAVLRRHHVSSLEKLDPRGRGQPQGGLGDPGDVGFDMARCGIAIYGMDPFGEDPDAHGLRPALSLSSYIADVKLCRPGESTGYGRRFVADHDTHIGMLPIGYGDGFRRALSGNAEVLVAGARLPLVGTVSMDNVAVDLGPDPAALELCGAEAVLIGSSGGEKITAEELAKRIGTINYEITCGLSSRVPRVARAAPGVSPAVR